MKLRSARTALRGINSGVESLTGSESERCAAGGTTRVNVWYAVEEVEGNEIASSIAWVGVVPGNTASGAQISQKVLMLKIERSNQRTKTERVLDKRRSA